MRVHALWLLCFASPVLAGSADWIGREVPPYPDGLVSSLGACVGSGTTPDAICASGMGVLDDARGRPRYLVAERAAGHVGNQAHWIITDAIALPLLRRGEQLALATCERDGAADAGIVAVVDTTGAEEMYETVRWAVRLQDGKFVRLQTSGIACYNEGYGE
ncbi:hypothetical protein [Lysobacter fragariae]